MPKPFYFFITKSFRNHSFCRVIEEEMRVNGNRSSHAKKPSMRSCREVMCGVHIKALNFFYKITCNPLHQRVKKYNLNVILYL